MNNPSNGELHVVFGTSGLGKAVMRELLSRGKRVRMVSRSIDRKTLPEGVEAARADAAVPDQTRKACEGATVVYHCAAPDYTQWAKLYPAMQAGVIAGAAAAGAKLVSAESVYAYGPVAGRMTENLASAATTRKGKIRAQLSEMLMDAHQAGKIRAIIARAPDFFGPEAVTTTIYGERVFYPVLEGKSVSVMGKLDAPHTFIYLPDFARGMVTLGERDEAVGGVWHVPAAPTVTQREFLTMIFEEAGKPPRMAETPGLVVQGLGLFMPIMRELSELLYQWEMPYLFDHSKFAAAFPDAVQTTPHREAIRETLTWFKAHPKPKD